MNDFTFKPAGAAIAAIVAGLAPFTAGEVAAEAAQPAKPDAAEELAAAAAKFAPAVPFGASNIVEFKRQRDLFE